MGGSGESGSFSGGDPFRREFDERANVDTAHAAPKRFHTKGCKLYLVVPRGVLRRHLFGMRYLNEQAIFVIDFGPGLVH